MPSLTRTNAYLRRSTAGRLDERTVPANQVGDSSYVPRLSWSSFARETRNDTALVNAIRAHHNCTYFVDNSFIDDSTDPDAIAELLSVPGRMRLIGPVRQELEPYLRDRPSHPVAQALRDHHPALALHPPIGWDDRGRFAAEFYISLLARRRLALDVTRNTMARERGQAPEDQDPSEVRDRVQRTYGERGLLLALKPMSPLGTDEILVFSAVAHAIRTGQLTAILTRDHDIEEQFFKLTWMLCDHYKSMLCADQYGRDFGSFRTIPVPERHRDVGWWPIKDGGAVLVDAGRWGDCQDGVLPEQYTFVGISCLTTGPVTSQLAFGAERGMSRLLDIKDRTRGRSTEELGSRNLHSGVPATMLPANDPRSYVLIARDVTVKLLGARPDVPWIDVNKILLSGERPRRVVLQPEPRIVSPRSQTRRGRDPKTGAQTPFGFGHLLGPQTSRPGVDLAG